MCDFACKASATLSIHRKNKHNIITPRMKVTKAKTKKEKPASPPALPLQQQQNQPQQVGLLVDCILSLSLYILCPLVQISQHVA